MDRLTVRELLLTELRELSERQRHIEAHLRNKDRTMPQDSGEQALFVENDEVLEALDDHGRARLAALRAALARMDAGQWGICAVCGDPIPAARLKVMPEASTYVGCAG